MTILKPILTCAFVTICLSSFSQSRDTTVFLKWKLKPGEGLTYKTIMKEIDTINHKDISMSGLSKAIGVEDKSLTIKIDEEIKKLNAELEDVGFLTHLTEKKKGVIDIKMFIKRDSIKAKKKTPDKDHFDLITMMGAMSGGVALRGAINEDGTIQSFYTKGDQKNLLAMFFELPGKPVKVGESWKLDVNFISMDQNFVCDSSYKKNNVTLVSVENRNGEHVAILKYNITEYVDGNFIGQHMSMKMAFEGMSAFSIEKGQWVMYAGIMSIANTGMMAAQITKKVSLIAE